MDKFAAKSEVNLRLIAEERVIKKLCSLEEHNDVYVRYFSLKNLGRLCSLPEARTILLADEAALPHYVSVFIKSADIVIQDLSACILAQLTMEHNVCEALVNTEMFKTLLSNVLSSDPDVSRNSLQITVNILEDPLFAREFAYCPHFTFVPFLKLIRSEYPEIQQLAIQVVQAALNTGRDQDLYQAFIKSGGFITLMESVEIFEWKDIHGQLLCILETATDTMETAKLFFQTGYVDRLSMYMEVICDPQLVRAALGVVIKISQLDEGRQALHNAGIDTKLCLLLQEKDPGLLTMVCQALPLVAIHTFARNTIVDLNPVPFITTIIQDVNFPAELRITASFCLSELSRLDKRICMAIAEFKRHELLICLLKLPASKVTVEMSINIVVCLRHLSVHADIRDMVLEAAVVDALLTCLQAENIQLKVSACYTLIGYICQASGKDMFLLAGGEKMVLACLKCASLPLRQAAASLVQVAACDSVLAKALIFTGVLQWLLDQKVKGTGYVCPSWNEAIESLFNQHLPSKFAYRKRLELQDVTTDGFYATMCVKQPFLILEQLLMMEVSPLRPIYVANFISSDEDYQLQKSRSKTARVADYSASSLNFQELLYESFGKCTPDPYLPKYLSKLQEKLAESDQRLDPPIDAKTVLNRRAKVLAEFVFQQLCGSDPNETCNSHTLELHLNQLKISLESNVIPLGYLRVGLHYERALLFKVLADRVGMPCALAHGEYGRAWVELAQPHHLRPNVVIDLVNDIGRLIPIGSYDACKYCNIPV